jgi:hypothetical protein
MNSALRTFVLGGVLGAGIVSGGALALAQTTGTTVPPAGETTGTTPGTTAGTAVPPAADGDAAPAPPAADPGAAPAPTDPSTGKAGNCGPDGGGGGRKGGGFHLGERAEDLAAELGVTVDQLRAAEQAARQAVQDQLGQPTRPSTRPPSDEDKAKLQADMKARAELHAKTLADKLGVTTDRLRAAREAVAVKRLDEAVAAGKLTRQQADDLLAKLRQGDGPDLGGLFGGKGPGGGHGRGGPGRSAPDHGEGGTGG